MDLRWLSAPDDAVAQAMATLRRDARPRWMPTRRQVLVHVDDCLILWYVCLVFLPLGVRVDEYEGGHLTASDVPVLVVTMTILAAWLYGAYRLRRWAARPPSPRARLAEWRQTLTALANGFEPRPSPTATFASLVTAEAGRVHEYPRFVAAGIEFGNLRRSRGRSRGWHYLAVTLPAPLPHLVLDAVANNRFRSDLPGGVDRARRLSLEGDFDRSFHVYVPAGYERDALVVLTPDVMAALADDAARFDLEFVDDRLVFFTSPAADFGAPAAWQAVDAILADAVPRITDRARGYRDDRVPGQSTPRVLAAIRAELDHPGVPWLEPAPRIGPDGRRLVVRSRWSAAASVLGAIGWFALLTLLYAVPGIFAFAGFMSIVDGR